VRYARPVLFSLQQRWVSLELEVRAHMRRSC
jgi:hypothetical protein